MPAPILIAQQDKYGIFTKVGVIGLTASNTKVEVIDTTGVKNTFDIPETGLLSFKVTVAAQSGGNGQDYFVGSQAAQSGFTAIFEISELLELKLNLQPSIEPAGLALKFIGEDEQDVLREMAAHSLSPNTEFGFRKKANSVVLEVYRPVQQ